MDVHRLIELDIFGDHVASKPDDIVGRKEVGKVGRRFVLGGRVRQNMSDPQ